MLSVLFSLAISSVTAQNNSMLTNSTSPSCEAALMVNLTVLANCSSYINKAFANFQENGTLPDFPTQVDVTSGKLDTFCSANCTDALNGLVGDILSPLCDELPFSANMSRNDFPIFLKVVDQALCAKDGTNYCAPTVVSILNADVSNPSSLASLVCTTCAKIEGAIFQTVIPTFSAGIQALVKPGFDTLSAVQNQYCAVPSATPTPNASLQSAGAPWLTLLMALLSL